ncbi:MAG: zinc finger domain-containing protein, partial [Gammaproteobacteria bacterium]
DPAIGDVVCRARRTGPGRRLADVLLDQRIAAGIGNAYKSELLFLRRLAPDRTLGELDDEELRALFSLAGALIRANLGGGPRTTRFLSDRAGRLWVYRRRGEPCLRCGTLVRMARLGEDRRSTYWCPACQGTAQSTG